MNLTLHELNFESEVLESEFKVDFHRNRKLDSKSDEKREIEDEKRNCNRIRSRLQNEIKIGIEVEFLKQIKIEMESG